VAGKSFEELVEADLALLAAAGVTEGVGGPGAEMVDLDRFQAEYLDQLPRGHGSHGYVGACNTTRHGTVQSVSSGRAAARSLVCSRTRRASCE
jgi:hypothetical protein